MKSTLLFSFVFFYLKAFSQTPGIDKVYDYQFGNNTTFGQSAEFFPENIFGNPDSNATLFVPSVSENQLVSLGLNGWIIVEFTDNIIRDFAGPDFTVFENCFYVGNDTTRIWIEPGIVSVSKNGTDFFEFPYDSVSFQGCAGTKPTNGKENPQNYLVSGGNSFDLSLLGIDSVRFIKIEDRSRWVNGGNGFDLDAVVATQTVSFTHVKTNETKFSKFELKNFPNPFNPTTILEWNQQTKNSKVIVTDLLGKIVFEKKYSANQFGTQQFQLNFQNQSSGTYLVVIETENQLFRKTIQLLK